ncbi:MAG: nitroreductase family deazaflavin-dependent oxidoreductase [Acidimicrobiales bacterium]
MSDPNDFNQQVITEFRSAGGKVAAFEGATVVLLHHRGRSSGVERVNPLVAQPLQNGWAVFGSKGGAPTHPDWYRNLMASPRATIEIGTDRLEVDAREADGEERDRIWSRQKELMPGFADYERTAGDRTIPVIVLQPVG